MDVQPVTSLIIWASLPEMTRVLLGARVAFYVQGVQRLDAPWSKSIQPDTVSAYGTLPSSSCPYLPTPFLMAGRPLGVAWPIQAGQLHAHQRSTAI